MFAMSTVAMAATTMSDVKGTKYEDAVDLLIDLKIVNGYDDGTYKPGNSVKRGEMAKFLILSLGKDGEAKQLEGDTVFSDVTKKHWASGYINLASNLNLIKGYPDGTFRPEETVSYVEASTMLLRALNYGSTLDSLSWPTGYMEKANDAGLLKGVTGNSSTEAALRGNIALMVVNTLKAHTQKIVAQNSNGMVYGDGDVLMDKTFPDYVAMERGTIINFDLEEKTITVKDNGNSKEVELPYTETNLKKMLGREISFIYDSKNETYISSEIVDEKTVKEVLVDEVYDDVLYDDDDNEYALPSDSHMVLIGISDCEDAEKAYITLDKNKKVEYMVLEGTEEYYMGYVWEISGTDATIVNEEEEDEDIVLTSRTPKVSEGDVIFYTVNRDEKATVKKVLTVNDGYGVKSVDSKNLSIKLDGQDKVTFRNTSKFDVFVIYDDMMTEEDLSAIDIEADKVAIVEFNNFSYVVVFADTMDWDEVEAYRDAVADLEDLLDEAELLDEDDYDDADAWEYFLDVYDDALYAYEHDLDAMDSDDVLALIDDLQDAIDELEGTTTTSDQDRLRKNTIAMIEEYLDIAYDYTKTSWNKLDTGLSWSKLQTKLDDAEEAIASKRTTVKELQSILQDLMTYIPRK